MRLKILVTSLVAATCLSSCGTPPSYADLTPTYSTSAENVRNDNSNLGVKLQNKITEYYPGSKVKVYADNFSVLILGQVKTTNIKNEVTALVKSEPNVKDVWNYLTVNPKPKFSMDSGLTDKVHERIASEKNINPDNIVAEAADGVVYLMGSNIGNLTYLDRAIRGIYAIDGVSKVINLTRIGPDDYRSQEDADTNN